MNHDRVPKNIRNSPFLRFKTDGSVRLRRGRLTFLAVGFLAWAVAILFNSRVQGDVGMSPPLILGIVAAMILNAVVQIRRHLQIAREPGRRRQMSLFNVFLLFTAAAIFLGSFGVHRNQRESELLRRDQLRVEVEELLGPGGKLERDHRARVWLTVTDPTFDDARMERVAVLLATEAERYGITRFVVQPKPGPMPWVGRVLAVAFPGVTDRSVEVLLKWGSLRELILFDTCVSAVGAERLADLPNLHTFLPGMPAGDDVVERIRKKKPKLFFFPLPAIPAIVDPAGDPAPALQPVFT